MTNLINQLPTGLSGGMAVRVIASVTYGETPSLRQNLALSPPLPTQASVLDGMTADERVVRSLAALAEFAPLPTLQPGTKAERRRRKAVTKSANPLPKTSIALVERYIADHSRSPASDLLKFRLSLRAGLRAGEIAAMRVDDMIAAGRSISDVIEVRTLKQRYKKRMREVDMHPEIREAFAELLKQHGTATRIAFSVGRDGQLRYQSAGCVANWFYRLYKNVGLLGCSSHSGRRTFATDVARLLSLHQGSMRDLQIAMGHARMSSTECYLEPSDKMREIILSLGS